MLLMIYKHYSFYFDSCTPDTAGDNKSLANYKETKDLYNILINMHLMV